ncbi:hypothetical protein B0H16DRAFT_74831 [Mycena metata]|uniref:Uncharacterized protein n=1 Tax=Mycena metata TaxID=1033252 RepID=A0AAD7NTT6_9AGAR|nr:hypothetical protein B0H16DRAFT_74831 [Mycena metata]
MPVEGSTWIARSSLVLCRRDTERLLIRRGRRNTLPQFQPSSCSNSLLFTTTTMCKWRQGRHNYTGCGHVWDVSPEEIKCDSTRCKFSSKHPSRCGPNCTTSEWSIANFLNSTLALSLEYALTVSGNKEEAKTASC